VTERVTAAIAIGKVKGVMSRPGFLPAAGVMVLHEIDGINAAVRDSCERLADAGYVAFAPDLYSRGFKPLCIARTIWALARNEPAPVADLAQCLRWLQERPEVDERSVGVIGFCMGGGFALALAVNADVSVAAVNYGGVPTRLEELTGVCPIVASYGAADRRFAEDGQRLQGFLEALEVPHDVKVYDGATHSFMNNHRGPLAARLFSVRYDPIAAEDAWIRTMDFFAQQLANGPSAS
jgi:carboxymethylenebutenolidase